MDRRGEGSKKTECATTIDHDADKLITSVCHVSIYDKDLKEIDQAWSWEKILAV